jgi:hypothetical protein
METKPKIEVSSFLLEERVRWGVEDKREAVLLSELKKFSHITLSALKLGLA